MWRRAALSLRMLGSETSAALDSGENEELGSDENNECLYNKRMDDEGCSVELLYLLQALIAVCWLLCPLPPAHMGLVLSVEGVPAEWILAGCVKCKYKQNVTWCAKHWYPIFNWTWQLNKCWRLNTLLSFEKFKPILNLMHLSKKLGQWQQKTGEIVKCC